MAMGEMSAVRQIHRQDFVSRLEERVVHGHVRATAGMGLYVGVLGAKELFRPINRQLLDGIHMFAAAIPTLAWVPFCVLICKNRPLRFHDGWTGEILAGNQFNVFLLALCFE